MTIMASDSTAVAPKKANPLVALNDYANSLPWWVWLGAGGAAVWWWKSRKQG